MTQSEYDGLNPKDAAKLYFTSDSHRIYKGSDLYAATTFDQLNFSAISASSITVDGSAVSLVGHSHSMSDIDGLASAITAATSGFASESHTHVIGDIQSLTAKVSGLTSNKVSKTNAEFTNLSANNADLTSISASTATFGDLIVTGEVTMSLSMVTFGSIMASDIQVDGTSVALVGHTHPASEVTGLQSMLDGLSSTYAPASHSHAISDITNLSSILTGITSSSVEKDTVTADVGYFGEINVSGSANLTVNNISASAISVNGIGVALEGHGHSAVDISGLETVLSTYASSGHTHVELQGITSNAISKDTGTFTNLVVADASFTATSVGTDALVASSISASTATFGDINVTGTATLSTTNVTASTLTAGAGSFTTLTVGGSNVALEGHTHSQYASIGHVHSQYAASDHNHNGVYASASHTHLLSDITNVLFMSLSAYDALGAYDPNTLYFTSNPNRIYIGSELYAATTFDQLNFGTISASGITIDGSAVSLEGHGHSVADIDGLVSAISAATSGFASSSHTHAISDITDLSSILSGITSSSLEKNTVTADIGNFRLLSVSGSANFSVNNVSANSVTVNGSQVALVGHTHSVADVAGLSTVLSAYASASHSHAISDITNLQTTLNGLASSGHTHAELAGITSNSISKTNGDFSVLTASAATFGSLTISGSSMTLDVADLVASTITVAELSVDDLTLDGTLTVSGMSVSAMTVTDLSVTGTIALNNKVLATQEYVLAQISAAIGQVLASAY